MVAEHPTSPALRVRFSPRLGMDMARASGGHAGRPLLLFPPRGEDFLAFSRRGVIDALRPWLDAGQVRCHAIDTPDRFSWADENCPTWRAIAFQDAYCAHLTEELLPELRRQCDDPTLRVAVAGIGAGAYQAADQLFRRPDLFDALIGVSGCYDLHRACRDGYFDQACYYHSPVDFLPGLEGETLRQLREECHIRLVVGRGAGEEPDATAALAGVLGRKKIPFVHDVWGHDVDHSWRWWGRMLAHHLDGLLA